jgi:hypothetical protein
MASHPHVRARGAAPTGDGSARAVLLTTDVELESLVEQELVSLEVTLQIARTVRQVIAALIDDPPPRAQILLADFDALTATDIVQLHQVREQGWFGAIVAVGRVPPEFGTSLKLHRIVPRPVAADALRRAVSSAGLNDRTRRISTLRGDR